MCLEVPNPFTGSKLITLQHEKVTKDQLEAILGESFEITSLADEKRLAFSSKRKKKEKPNALATQLLRAAGKTMRAFGPAVLLIKAAASAKLG
jgi:hypothetical protein